MTPEEAYEVLGLQPGATEAEIRAAHHRLMRSAHPDSGGSDWLATRVNQARDVLLGASAAGRTVTCSRVNVIRLAAHVSPLRSLADATFPPAGA